MGELLDLSVYNPAQLTDEDFLAGFVARQGVADKILARLGEIRPRGVAQHRLILGQRGMGKTSLLRRISLGVRRDPATDSVLLPLSFREEQYNVHNLHVFWCNCLDALADWFESSAQSEKAKRLDAEVADLDPRADDDEGSQALQVLQKWMRAEGKRLVLLLDNLDIVLAGIRSKQWSLRRVLQQSGGIVVVGASGSPLEAAASQDEAFFDFFQVDVLDRLEHHEVLLCLRQLAHQRNEPGRAVLGILDRDPARIHVLTDLTGGNPRTLTMLYMVLEGENDDVMHDLERLLDHATPFYRARVEALAPQARVVFDALALNWDPTTAADLAATTGLEVNAVSAQLDRLVRDAIVEKVSLSKTTRTAFQVGERFFNVWYLMRHGPRRHSTRLRWLTEMLRQIHTPRDLESRAAKLLAHASSEVAENATHYLTSSGAVAESATKNRNDDAEQTLMTDTALRELVAVLSQQEPELLTDYRDDLQRVFRLAAERGHGQVLLDWLDRSGLSDRYWPLRAAFDAYLHGEERLRDVNPEVRAGARVLLGELNRGRPAIPQASEGGGPPSSPKRRPARAERARRPRG